MVKLIFFLLCTFAGEIDQEIINNIDFYLSMPIIEEEQLLEIEENEEVVESLLQGEGQ
jgi:hypothetical protein